MSLSARQILEALVSFPTVSRDSNNALVNWVEDYLAGLGIVAHRMPNEDGTKHAIYCSVGPDLPGGVVFSGHTDVVPVEGQDWASDPWTVTERDGKLYGRGTCDMKGFDALALHALQRALTANLRRPLQVALSFDEEVGCVGAPPLIEHMATRVPKAEAAIIGEPSMLKCVTGHKGGAGFHVHVRGHEVHSSIMHKGVNAVMEGARLIAWAHAKNAENRSKSPSMLAAVFEPPWTTLHVGQIEGGTAHNITARDCRFGLDFRVVPDEDPEAWKTEVREKAIEISAEMADVHPGAGIRLSPYFGRLYT